MSILSRPCLRALSVASLAACALSALAAPPRNSDFQAPIAVYTHTSAPAASSFDQAAALDDIDQLVRLKKSGVRFDYDLIDAALFAPNPVASGGADSKPDLWIAKCRAAGIRPGLLFTTNSPGAGAFNGRSLPDLIPSLQSWYDRGIRLFEFNLAAPPETHPTQDQPSPGNAVLLRQALAAFRAKNHDALLVIVDSGPDPSAESQAASNPPPSGLHLLLGAGRQPAYAMVSIGPLELSPLPQPSLQRSIDIGSDNQVRRLEDAGVPLAQIYAAGFQAAPAGSPGSGSQNPPQEWQGTFLLSMARGGWMNTVTGNLDPIQPAEARWMARAQKLFFALDATGHMRSFGAPPGSGRPYGFAGATSRGSVYVVVNPSQTVATLTLPALLPNQSPPGDGRLQFRDAGFAPRLTGNNITLGPGQMAMVGFGAYTEPEFSFGIQKDLVIPSSIQPLDASFESAAPGVLEARIDPPIAGVLRVVVWEREHSTVAPASDAAGDPIPPASGNRFTLDITQAGRPIPTRLDGTAGETAANAVLGAESSWAVAEIDVNDLTPGIPLHVRLHTNEKQPTILEGRAYQVTY